MTAETLPQGPVPHAQTRMARGARPAVWFAMPLLGLANQYCAERVAHGLDGAAFGLDWVGQVVRSPWMLTWAGLEIVTLAAWMVVLAELSLSAAFPMTAAGYVLVIGLGWTVFHEPVSLLQVLGGTAILAGVWLLGQGKADA
jgi:multidrug transporter EmrE-like cation transporter